MRNGKGLHHHGGVPTGAAPDWDRLLLAGPDRIFKGLRAWLGPKRAEDTEVERSYWTALVARGDTEELAVAVIERLDLDNDRLLDLDAIDLPRIRESLEHAARERLDLLD